MSNTRNTRPEQTEHLRRGRRTGGRGRDPEGEAIEMQGEEASGVNWRIELNATEFLQGVAEDRGWTICEARAELEIWLAERFEERLYLLLSEFVREDADNSMHSAQNAPAATTVDRLRAKGFPRS